MNKTKIPWCDYTINPVKGLCPMGCSYCYARRMYKRFKWNPEIRYDHSCLLALKEIKQPSKIFVGSTMELFGKWIDPMFLAFLLGIAGNFPQHTFIFSTKQPQNLVEFSPFPDNCWILASATNQTEYNAGIVGLSAIRATVKGFSIEPLLGEIHPEGAYDLSEMDWIILGSQTQPTRHPRKECVEIILSAAQRADVPVFVKEPLASHIGIQRQEFPK